MGTYKALTIAGSDSGGGAGIQADIKTFQELQVFGMTAITAITSQNTLGVQDVFPIPVETITSQLKSIADDLTPDALKTGMLFSSELIEAVSEAIRMYSFRNLVVDPVMVAKGGAQLLQEEAVEAVKNHLIPLATIITPNIPEAEVLTGKNIKTIEDRKEAAKWLKDLGAEHVIIKGGHGLEEMAVDLYYDGTNFELLSTPRLQTKNTHGTGCTFSAAITANLAKGKSVFAAVQDAKNYIQLAIQHDLKIGSGHGPTNHWAHRLEGVSL
ncbi:bifunctional hydroxymethylpyrimidine kinase/phosphomethylpyrimidine kinase [Bacillus pinisoli]|uniref:bifunctional hydroxymethylpyrimidine kinase/phosphomethylpyrimidine kinase n=1 Tax=Bacillus pinisoli TaxID=2901866 RepID=UPI001FF6F109|nr:bifunctional hydroxymethylpyrimidine kinase/phosphomethylpyrimidine kinase [Bacillus pinisoli]